MYIREMSDSHLVLLHLSTAGKQGEDLGADEQQIVMFVYVLLDVSNNKVVTIQSHHVKPTNPDGYDFAETNLSEECKVETGIQEDLVKNAQPLEHVIDEFDRFLKQKGIHPDHGGSTFCLCTDGPLHLRLVLHPETTNKNLSLQDYFFKYYDLRKEFKKHYKAENVSNIKDTMDFLSLEENQSVEYGARQAQDMSNIVQRLITDGHAFCEPEIIKDRLEPGICDKTEFVDDETVVRARGLPWQSSDQDIARFFMGLNVAKGGVALCLSQQGRRNGEALIRFDTKESKDLALRKHKHHLGQRYIEVYKANGKDFINVAGGSNSEAQAFLSRGSQVIIRMRGLPYSATAEQVLEFYRRGDSSVEVLDGEDGILFVHQADGRATGDAFVLLASDEDANKALTKHRESIGTRYIELFKSTTAEVQQVLNRSMDPRNPSDQPDNSMAPLIAQIPQSLSNAILPQQVITSGTRRDCIRMRGLPFEATVQDILNFLGEHSRNIVFQGVHMVYNAQGTPSGEAFIQMDSELAAESGAANRHKKFMLVAGSKKPRYVEVFQVSGEDMNLVLTSGTLPPPPGGATLPVSPHMPTILPQQPSTAAMMAAQAAQAAQMVHRPIISPGATLLPQQAAAYNAAMASLAGASPYPLTHAQIPQPTSAAAMSTPFAMPFNPLQAAAARPQHAYYPGVPQMLYWYPSPPVSPQTYYAATGPSVVVMRGLPFTASNQDIIKFFEGLYEVTNECIQIQRNIDGRGNGDALITFASRQDAERAITECNRKVLGNRYVELFMA